MRLPLRLCAKRSIAVLVGFLIVSACGTVQHKAMLEQGYTAPMGTKFTVSSVKNQTGQSFDIDVEKLLADALEQALKDKSLLGNAESKAKLMLEAEIVEYAKGDAFKRWLMPGWGSTVLVVKATLLNGEKKNVGNVEAKRTVDAGGGYTIGAWESIFRNVAEDIVADLGEKVK